MSMANPDHHAVHEKIVREEDYPFWTQAFHSDLRTEQLREDHNAWAAVTGELLTIVSVGVTLAVISVVLCW